MDRFVYESLSTHVVFGRGAVRDAGAAIGRVDGSRALLLTTPAQAGQAAAALDGVDAIVARFSDARMHTPVEVTDRAVAAFRDADADCLVAFGGGSTTGLGKAVALRTGAPQVVIPTTYAGSEMTPILGQTEGGRKTTMRTPAVLPAAVIYDVELTLALPAALSGTSGVNAIAHGVEGLYARDGNPVMRLIAEDGVRALAGALPRIVQAPDDIAAREQALYGAWLCGMVLGAVGMALHHKLCHALGGGFDLPHAETHTVLLPHVVAFNAPAAADAMQRLSRALGRDDPADALVALARDIGAPMALKDIGMPESGLDLAADEAVRNPYWNPRPVDREAIHALIGRAWRGDRPQ